VQVAVTLNISLLMASWCCSSESTARDRHSEA
jgi:hypothetical protein